MPDLIAGKYEIIQTIGKGGMGTVYKARQKSLDRIVAIKMLSEELASDPEFRARFQQEATVVARLSHPGIVAVYDIEPHNHTFCIIMEFLEGENLQAKIDRDVTMQEREVVLIGAQVARALGYAHENGIIHRDIKPDNIHVTPNGVAKVMDFGIARFLDSKLKTQTGISMGTPKFMSPEQVTGKNVDGQTDLYSLGVCLYYCLAGRPPFDGENAISVATRHLYEQPELPSKINPSISPAVEKVIMKALEKQKPARYAKGKEMADALEATLGAKSPIRVDDSTGTFYPGVTQKLNQGELTPQGGHSYTPDSGYDTQDNNDMHLGADVEDAGGSLMTPLSVRALPQLENFPHDSAAARNIQTPHDPTRPFKISLAVFITLIVCVVLFLIFTVMFLRNTEQSTITASAQETETIAKKSPSENFSELENRTATILQKGRVMDARKLWLDFQKDHPDVRPADVARRIDLLTSKLPLNEGKTLLARRREEIGTRFIRNNNAVAYAYFKAAAPLDDTSSATGLAGSLKQMLSKQLNQVTPEQVAKAHSLLTEADARMAKNQTDETTENMLLSAVDADYTNPQNWLALGRYYEKEGRTDDARVVITEAYNRATTGSQNKAPGMLAEISSHLDALNRQ